MTLLRCAMLLVLLLQPAVAASAQDEPQSRDLMERLIGVLQTRTGDDAREAPLAELLREAEALREQHPDSAQVWLTVARVRFWYADTQSLRKGLAGLKTVRAELEQAMTLDTTGNPELAQAFLGYLYYAAPPWPFGFRDREEGERLLLAMLARDPDSVYGNFYYGMVRTVLGDTETGSQHLRKVQGLLRSKPLLSAEESYVLQGAENLLAGA